MLKILRNLAVLVAAVGAVDTAYAGEGHVTVNAPGNGGAVTVNVAIPGIIPAQTPTGTATPVTVTIPAMTNGHKTTAAEKATLIANAINVAFGGPPAVATINAANTSQIDLGAPAGTPKAGQAGIGVVTKDNTHEGPLFASLDSIDPSYTSGDPYTGIAAVVDYHSTLTGVDANGATSTFSTTFGSDSFSDTASISYGGAIMTVDDVVSALYLGLIANMPSIQPDLTLDLPDDAILFDLPTGQTNYFVTNASSDTGVELTGGFEAIPEPSGLTAVGLGGLYLCLSARRRHSA